MPSSRRFTTEELSRIQTAVAAAELGTSGEIVPVFAETSGGYAEAPWKAGVLSGVLGVAGAWFLFPEALVAGELRLLLAFAAPFGAGFAAAILWPSFHRLFTSAASMEAQVEVRAEAAFTREQLFATRDRTGILIYVSFLEQRVRVLADSGIHARVKPGTWDGVVARVVAGMKAGRPTDGIVDAVGLCGELLRQHGFVARPDDTNELPDGLRLEIGSP